MTDRFLKALVILCICVVSVIAIGASATAFYIIYRNECCSPPTVHP